MRKTNAFTIVELLIVMAILALLMTIGIVVGQYAISQANKVQHEKAADKLSEAIVAYSQDFRRYPTTITDNGNSPTEGVLAAYLEGVFDGGSEASFYYDTDTTGQIYIICVTYGGANDIDQKGVYCEGNGYDEIDILNGMVTQQTLDYNEGGSYVINEAANSARSTATWDGSQWIDITTRTSE